MAYKRQIAYFDLLEDGQKKGNAGFCKWEQRNDYHVLAVSIGGLPGDISENTGVYTKTGNMLGSLKVIGGRAEAAYDICHSCGWDSSRGADIRTSQKDLIRHKVYGS